MELGIGGRYFVILPVVADVVPILTAVVDVGVFTSAKIVGEAPAAGASRASTRCLPTTAPRCCWPGSSTGNATAVWHRQPPAQRPRETRWRRCWTATSRPALTASVAFATPPPRTRAIRPLSLRCIGGTMGADQSSGVQRLSVSERRWAMARTHRGERRKQQRELEKLDYWEPGDVDTSWRRYARCKVCRRRICVNNNAAREVRPPRKQCGVLPLVQRGRSHALQNRQASGQRDEGRGIKAIRAMAKERTDG